MVLEEGENGGTPTRAYSSSGPDELEGEANQVGEKAGKGRGPDGRGKRDGKGQSVSVLGWSER